MTSEQTPSPPEETPLGDIIIQEPPKVPGVVGERLWGPYRTHSGIPNSEKSSGGPWGLGTSAHNQSSNTLISMWANVSL